MGIHPSLKIDTAGSQHRTVLTRIERIKDLMAKGLWNDDLRGIGLPKTKIVKIKARKTKAKEEAKPAEGKEAAAPASGAPQPAAKAAAPKAAAPKK